MAMSLSQNTRHDQTELKTHMSAPKQYLCNVLLHVNMDIFYGWFRTEGFPGIGTCLYFNPGLRSRP